MPCGWGAIAGGIALHTAQGCSLHAWFWLLHAASNACRACPACSVAIALLGDPLVVYLVGGGGGLFGALWCPGWLPNRARQRLRSCCALGGTPRCWLDPPSPLLPQDEPTTGMDPISRRLVWDRIGAPAARGRWALGCLGAGTGLRKKRHQLLCARSPLPLPPPPPRRRPRAQRAPRRGGPSC